MTWIAWEREQQEWRHSFCLYLCQIYNTLLFNSGKYWMDSWQFYRQRGWWGVRGRWAMEVRWEAEEKDRNGASGRVGREENERGEREGEWMNRTGRLCYPLCRQPAVYNLGLGSSPLGPSHTGWGASSASSTHSLSPNLRPQAQPEETSTLSSQTSVAGPPTHQKKEYLLSNIEDFFMERF